MSPSRGKVIQFALTFLITGLAAYFAVSFLSNFYTSLFTFVFLTVLFSVLFTLAGYLLAGEMLARLQSGGRREFVGLLVLFLAAGLSIAAARLSLGFPMLLDGRILFMDSASLPVFIGVALIAFAVCVFPLVFLEQRGTLDQMRASRALRFVRDNLAGLLLAASFFFTYFILAETVNFPGFRTLDQYFDLDISAWLARLQADSPGGITDVVRAVHPAVLLFLRPLVWFVSLFLHGDRLHAIFIVHALAAAGCVFLTWCVVKRASGSVTYALLAASLLGASASHLILGSMLDTYIYSALAILFFVAILQSDSIPLKNSVLAGIFVFGITVTNLLQTIVLYFMRLMTRKDKEEETGTQNTRLRLRRYISTRGRDSLAATKVVLQYSFLVVGIVLLLNVIQVWRYPAAALLTPHNILGEQGYRVDLTEAPWRLTGRVNLMARSILLYGILAPKPFVLMEELGMNVPNFRTFEITIGEFHVAGYAGLADITVKFWMLILLLAFAFFIWSWFKRPRPRPWLSLGLLVCLGFNFALHVLYGDDPLLYSPDWAYAVVLFVAFSFERFAERKWIQLPLLVFLALAMTINLELLRQIMEVSAPFYGK